MLVNLTKFIENFGLKRNFDKKKIYELRRDDDFLVKYHRNFTKRSIEMMDISV